MHAAHKFAGYVAPAKDSLTAYRLCRELGIHGRVAVTTAADGRSYVIVKGYPGTRSILTGTRYLSTHPKIVKLAIGRVGLAAAVAEGAMLNTPKSLPKGMRRCKNLSAVPLMNWKGALSGACIPHSCIKKMAKRHKAYAGIESAPDLGTV